MKITVFCSSILLHNKKILIMKRGPTAPKYPNFWDNPGGHLKDGHESAEDCIIRETKEECGLDVKIKKLGNVFEFQDNYGRAVVIPFLLESDSKKVKLSFEHTEYKWIEPNELKNYNCVKDLVEEAKMFGLIK